MARFWYFPAFEIAKWLLLGAGMHLALRLTKLPIDYDAILNVSGIAALIIDPVIRFWDWIVYAAGWWENPVLMDAAHALIFWPWGLDARAALAGNDSYHFLGALGDLVVTGPTQTNVNGLFFVFVF